VADRSRLWEIDEVVRAATAAATAAAEFAQLAQAACGRAAAAATAIGSPRTVVEAAVVEAAVVEAAEAMHDAEIEAAAARRVERVVGRWAAEWRAAGEVVPPLRWA